MNESSGDLLDSTANGFTATANGDLPDPVAAAIGTGQLLGGNASGDYALKSGADSALDVGTDYSAAIWFQWKTTSPRYPRFFAYSKDSDNGFTVILNDTTFGSGVPSLAFRTTVGGTGRTFNTTDEYAVDTFFRAWFVKEGSVVKIYVNGAVAAGGTTTSKHTVYSAGLRIGAGAGGDSNDFGGILDEALVTQSSISANYITTEYNNQNSYSTFYSVAAVAGSSAAQAARRGAVMMM